MSTTTTKFIELTRALAAALNGHELDMGPRQALGLLVAHAERVAHRPSAPTPSETTASLEELREQLYIASERIHDAIDGIVTAVGDDATFSQVVTLEILGEARRAWSALELAKVELTGVADSFEERRAH